MSKDSVVFQGFTVLQMKVEESSKAIHYLYVKEHSVRETHPSKPKDRTLFVLNVPTYCKQEHLKCMFGQCGGVSHVHLHNKPTSGQPEVTTNSHFPTAPVIEGYKVAYVVFKKASSIKRALSLPYSTPLIMSPADGPPIVAGMSKQTVNDTDQHNTETTPEALDTEIGNADDIEWCQEYREDAVDKKDLQQEIDQYMADYDKKIQQEVEQAKAQEGQADEDGWVTVTRYGKNKAAPRTEAHEKAINHREKKRRKEKELLNFYSFQIRETKRSQIADLRKKFEEDKQRIALMKEARKFRPY